ncbi:MAG: Mannose-1-phosphate guanylyltransferase / Mannose-6-phosphate isomerase, partial [uncultured Rubrobacteraceae bacterium]
GPHTAINQGRQALGRVRAVHAQPALHGQDHHGRPRRLALAPVPPPPRRAVGGPGPRRADRAGRGGPLAGARGEALRPPRDGPQALGGWGGTGAGAGGLLRRVRRGRHRAPGGRLRPRGPV